MIRRLLLPVLASALLLAGCQSPDRPVEVSRYPGPVRVACIGDSITEGYPIKLASQHYPERLGSMLGVGWDVRNFGCGGATLLDAGDKPYRKLPHYQAAKAFLPDVVVIMLGTNDSKPWNWRHREHYAGDYASLIHDFSSLPTHPRIWICKPMPAWPPSGWEISPVVIEKEIGPLVGQIARENRTGLIDQFANLTGHHDLAPDHVHPGEAGAELLARGVYRALTGHEPDRK